ncbi:MAG: type IV pilus assembly protein PilM [Acidimicrobiia bacterium]
MSVNVGLDIGASAVRAAVVDAGSTRPVLRRYGEMPLPAGAVAAGELLDEAAVVEAIAALWKRHRLPKRRVILGLANQRIVVRRIVLPLMDTEELVQSLPFQVQDLIPIPVEESALDHVPLGDDGDDVADNEQAVLVVAAHRDAVSAMAAAVRRAGLTVVAVDLQAFALVRSAMPAAPDDDTSGAIVDIGASMTQIVVARGGVARFVRILLSGGSDFTAALVDGLGMTSEDAEESKRRVGVIATSSEAAEGSDGEIQGLLTRKADKFIEEVRGSLLYYEGQSGGSSVERLVVAGNGARLPHLANRLGDQLGTRAEPARVFDLVHVGRVKVSADELQEAQPVLPTAVGLALWGSR